MNVAEVPPPDVSPSHVAIQTGASTRANKSIEYQTHRSVFRSAHLHMRNHQERGGRYRRGARESGACGPCGAPPPGVRHSWLSQLFDGLVALPAWRPLTQECRTPGV